MRFDYRIGRVVRRIRVVYCNPVRCDCQSALPDGALSVLGCAASSGTICAVGAGRSKWLVASILGRAPIAAGKSSWILGG